MTWLREKAWPWLVGLVLLLLGAGWLWKRTGDRRTRRDFDAIREAERDVLELRAERAVLIGADRQDDLRVAGIDAEIEANRLKLIEAHKVEGMGDDEVLRELERLGF